MQHVIAMIWLKIVICCLYFTGYLHTFCILQDIYILFVFYRIFTYCLYFTVYLHTVCILQYFYILLSMIFTFCLYFTGYLHSVCILQDLYILFVFYSIFTYCLLLQWISSITTQLSVRLVQMQHVIAMIWLKIVHFTLNNTYSCTTCFKCYK
jgi:hypothetical protein